MPAKFIAKCGLNCRECLAYKATIADSDELRKKTAEEWTVQFGAKIDYKDINCLGCKSDGPIFNHCKVCEIRSCSSEKNIPNCGHCKEYPCSKLNHIINHVPAAKDILDTVQEAVNS